MDPTRVDFRKFGWLSRPVSGGVSHFLFLRGVCRGCPQVDDSS